jgi:cell fate (sporulation/competence/biofilm development) regulator YlbF (YheA/YmcA/DUF963 family)
MGNARERVLPISNVLTLEARGLSWRFTLLTVSDLHTTPMESTTKESPIIQKTLELCETIIAQPDFQSLKTKLDAFLSDEGLKFQFQQVNEMGGLLEQRHRAGLEIKPEEIAQYETMHESVFGNPTVKDFVEAQQELAKLHDAIGRFVGKSFELGRKPEFEDVFDGSCGSGCGCH